ncbi:MAG: tape measure protein [Synechococcaceae cyanobacterium SM1_2_3]|nr:tape measure protein [Synechococcaceae cyanobacterium SM1_2_3]
MQLRGVSAAQKGLAGVQSQTSRMGKEAANASRGVDRLSHSISTLRNAFIGLGLARLGQSIVDTALKFERLQRAMSVAFGGVAQGRREFEYVQKAADRLGLNLLEAAQGYSRISIAAKGTALEGDGARKIFQSVSEASVVMGLSADETQGALRALEQMISKGNVQAEELRGQLGERLPGAFQLAARAMGVTTKELNKLLDGGKVTAEELLPKLADAIHNQFAGGLSDAANSAQATVNRFQTAWQELQVAFAESGFLEGVTEGMRDLAKTMKDPEFIGAIKEIGSQLGWLIKQTGAAMEFVGNAIFTIKSAINLAWDQRLNELPAVLRQHEADKFLDIGNTRERSHSSAKHSVRGRTPIFSANTKAGGGSGGGGLSDKALAREAMREEKDRISELEQNERALADLQARLWGDAQQMIERTMKPLDEYNNELFQLQMLYKGGYISAENFNRVLDDMNQTLAENNQTYMAFENAFDTLFDAAIDGAEDFSDILDDIGKQLAKDVLNANVVDPLKEAGRGLVGSILGGGRKKDASGGGSILDGGGIGGNEQNPMQQIFDQFLGGLGDILGMGDGGFLTGLQSMFMGDEGILGGLGGILGDAWEGLGGLFTSFLSEMGILQAWEIAERWALSLWEVAERWAIAIFEAVAGFLGFERGGEITVSRPTLFVAGEHNKAERVRVTPLAGARRNSERGGASGQQTPLTGLNQDKGTTNVNVFIPQTSVINGLTSGGFARQISSAVRRQNQRLV